GAAAQVLTQLAQETGAREIHALHHYEPWWRNAEKALKRNDLDLILHDGNFLTPPGSVTTGAGTQYRIYTPFWRQLQLRMPPAEPTPAPG
ncbi:deoxyribodipyrimidine photo-lyase, partial [Escherichia coli]|uniref:deoxyribodipyrimidine photo-lyase n=1 Tax=Escherichia coli TaxID=562 RepID=UPI003CF9BE5B